MFLAVRLNYALPPRESENTARTLSRILAQPAFEVCRRVSVRRINRQTSYAPKTAELIADYVLGPENVSVVIDNGRKGELIADVNIDTGLSLEYMDKPPPRPAPLLFYCVVPHEEELTDYRLDAFCEIARALSALSGAVTVERDFDSAERFALGMSSVRPVASELRRKERAAHYYFGELIDGRIAGPEWGIFLSRGHLEALPVQRLMKVSAIAQVRALEQDLAFVALTANPSDALRPSFDKTLEAARDIFRPILMDLSGYVVQ